MGEFFQFVELGKAGDGRYPCVAASFDQYPQHLGLYIAIMSFNDTAIISKGNVKADPLGNPPGSGYVQQGPQF